MSRWTLKHSQLSQCRTLLTVLGVAATAACTERPDTSQQPAQSVSPPVALASATVEKDDGLNGRPGDRVEETRAYIESLQWADTVKYATADFTVRSGSDSARVRVVPMISAQEVSWHEAVGIGMPGGRGHLVARIYNLDHKKIRSLGMMEEDTGYVWIGERPLSKRGAAIYVLKRNGNSIRHTNLSIVGFCSGQHPGPKVRSTQGRDCQGGLGTSVAQAQLTAGHMVAAGQGLWIACRGGCCEVALPN